MAKHPHKLMLIDNRTWRCMLDGCAFFVHLGLAHVIVGKRIVCWKCEETFLVRAELSTREPRPECESCRAGIEIPDSMDLEAYIQKRIAQNKKKEDEIEVFEPDEEHAPECEVHVGGECTCQ